MSAATPFRSLAFTLALLAIATCAQARTTWFGPQFSIPLPTRDAGDSEPGGSFGVTATDMHRAHAGSGIDFVYHYWPVSPEYKADYDRFLSDRRGRVIDGSEWAISAFQLSGHVKLVAPLGARFTPWIKAGIGIYRVDSRLTGLSGTRITLDPGLYGSVGFDFAPAAGTAIGLDATLHQVRTADFYGRDFAVLTAGMHVLFGR